MKREALLASALLAMLSFSGAVVYENGSSPSNNVEDGEMAITSHSGSAGATTAVGPNGTEYTAKVEMLGRSPNVTEERLENVSIGYRDVSFTGYIQAPTPCHTLTHEVKKSGSEYVLDIGLEAGEGACAQQVTMIRYSAEFESETPFTLDVRHDGEAIRSVLSDGVDPGKGAEPVKGPLQALLDWLKNIL